MNIGVQFTSPVTEEEMAAAFADPETVVYENDDEEMDAEEGVTPMTPEELPRCYGRAEMFFDDAPNLWIRSNFCEHEPVNEAIREFFLTLRSRIQTDPQLTAAFNAIEVAEIAARGGGAA